MAHTKKPCPGCGQIDRNRAADQVCGVCRKKLDRIAAIEAEAEQLRATVSTASAMETKPRLVYLPTRNYNIMDQRDRLIDSPEFSTFRLSTAAVIRSLTQPLDQGRKTNHWNQRDSVPAICDHAISESSAENFGYAELSDEAVKTVRQWWKDLTAFGRTCYAAGVEDGRDLLVQLANGGMTLDQVNERALNLTRRR